MIEDALKVGVTRDQKIIDTCLRLLKQQVVAVDFKTWFELPCKGEYSVRARLQRAGHILGSAYVEIDISTPPHKANNIHSDNPTNDTNHSRRDSTVFVLTISHADHFEIISSC